MSTPALKTVDTPKAAPKAAPKEAPKAKTRAPRKPSISVAQRFELMSLVKAADPATPDSVVAKSISAAIGHEVSQQTVAGYRKSFGIASVRKPTAAQLYAYVDALKAQIEALGHAPVSMPEAQ